MDENSISSQPIPEEDEEEDSTLMMGEDEYNERMQMMAKYLRSKSLPVVYFPPFGMNRFLPLLPPSITAGSLEPTPEGFPASPVNSLEEESSSRSGGREFPDQKNASPQKNSSPMHPIDPTVTL